ncbi:MAG: leucine-rich repeat protein [Bacillota bacterium]
MMITAFMPVTSFGAVSYANENNNAGVQHEEQGTLVCDGDLDPDKRFAAKTRDGSASTEAREAAHIKVREIMNNNGDLEYYRNTMYNRYSLTDDQIDEMTGIAEEATAGCSTDYEKIKAIYEFVADNIYYDRDSVNGNSPGGTEYGYDAWVSKKTICGGYSGLCAIFLNSIDIPCIYERGDNHAYSVAWDGQDNRWIFFDSTWGSMNKYENGKRTYHGHTNYYFDMSESKIAGLNNHEVYEPYYMITDDNADVVSALNIPNDAEKWTDTGLWDIIIVAAIDKAIETINIEPEIVGFPVTAIKNSAFQGCADMTGISIPDSVTDIGYNAFEGCRSLSEIEMPASLTNIGKNAFEGCASITGLAIPDGVTTIRDDTFNGCKSLTTVSFPELLTSIDFRAFNGCSSLTDVTLRNVETIDNCAFSGCDSLTNVAIYDGLTSLGGSAFSSCGSLTDITLPDGLTSIGNMAFFNCKRLTDVKLPDSLVSIGRVSFAGCDSLTSITIPAGLTSLGAQSFNNCKGLTEVTIMDGLTSIDDYTFNGCSSLARLELPDSIASIGKSVFVNCGSICIYCNRDSFAHSYAADNGIDYKLWKPLSDCSITLEQEEYHTTGEPIQPEVTVMDGDTVLKEGVEYSVSGSDAVVGDASVTVTGLDNYTGDVEACFRINDHQWNDSYTTDCAATCTEAGTESIHCSVCGAKKNERPVPAAGHDFGEWIILEQETCENAGLQMHTCDVCGFTETEGLEPAGHDWEESYTTDVAATCTAEGSESIHCKSCGARKDSRVIPAADHSWTHITNPAGLLKNGNEYDKCADCGAVRNESAIAGYAQFYVKSFKVAAGKKYFKARWKKQSAGNQKKFNGYQIRYSTKSSMSGAKTAIASKSSKSRKIKGLKAKTRYYVQVRTYTKSGGKTFYSKWSAKKSVKTK